MPSAIFRAEPPDEIVNDLLRCLGVHNLEDSHWWPKSSLIPSVIDKLNEQIFIIEPYYVGHRSPARIGILTLNHYINVIRQCVKTKGFRLESKEFGPDHESYASRLKYRVVPGPGKEHRRILDKDNPIFTVSFP
jgi:hypothetical protein